MHELKRRSFIGKMGAYLALVPIAFTSTAFARGHRHHAGHLTDDERLLAMERQMQLMAGRLGALEDVEAIRRLQHAYGYYLDKCLYDEIVGLFAEDGDIHFGDGIYRGRAGQKRFFAARLRLGEPRSSGERPGTAPDSARLASDASAVAGGAKGPEYGLLFDHLMVQDVIDVAPERRTAKARFRTFVQGGSHDSRRSARAGRSPGLTAGEARTAPSDAGDARQWWEGGIYENAYVKGDDGLWRFRLLSYRRVYQAPYAKGWAHTAIVPETGPRKIFPEDPLGPDEALPMPPPVWPETPVVPFHYPNPVTGKPWV